MADSMYKRLYLFLHLIVSAMLMATTQQVFAQPTIPFYQPVKKAALPQELEEVSGMLYWQNKLVMLNDGNNAAALYITDTSGAKLLQTVVLAGIENKDWEALAQDDRFFYIADVGNNKSGNRKDLVIYQVPKLLLNAKTAVIRIPNSSIGRIRFSYANKVSFAAEKDNTAQFDCEAMLVHNQQLHLFTKNWSGQTSYHYTIPTKPGTYKAALAGQLQTGDFKITDASWNGKNWLLLTAYTKQGKVGLFAIQQHGKTISLKGNVRQFELPSAIQTGQLESVCFDSNNTGWLATEAFSARGFTLPQTLYRFMLPL